jgi:hypothetical protein
MDRVQTTDVLSAKATPSADPTGRKIVARQFAVASIDPTGRNVLAHQFSAQTDVPDPSRAA